MRTDLSLEHFNFKIPLFLLVVHGISNKLIDAVDQLVKILRQPYNIPVSRFCGDMLELSGAVTNLVERAFQQGVKGRIMEEVIRIARARAASSAPATTTIT